MYSSPLGGYLNISTAYRLRGGGGGFDQNHKTGRDEVELELLSHSRTPPSTRYTSR